MTKKGKCKPNPKATEGNSKNMGVRQIPYHEALAKNEELLRYPVKSSLQRCFRSWFTDRD